MKLMVIDGNSIINRSFYGIRPLSTREGLFTHAVYGFVTTMQRLLDEEQPEALCVAFDRREPTFRHQADENYKATRHAMPEELAMQMPVLKEVLDAMDIPRYELVGWEADDLIGTISRRCEAVGWDCVAVTGDKDSLQLITDHTKVKLVSTRMGQTTTKDMTPETFRAAYGFDPIHMIDLKALMGDSSDNIPGVPGVGEKTAMALVQEYGSIDEIYRRLPDINAKPAAIRRLTEGEESARHSYWLATIVTDVPLEFAPEDNLRRPFKQELYDLFLKLEFSKLIEKYGLSPTRQTEKKAECTVTVEPITGEAQAAQLLEMWRQADHVTVYALPDLAALSVQWGTGADTDRAAELQENTYGGDWQALLMALFAADIRKVGHHIKDTMRALLERGVDPKGYIFDTALAAYLLDASASKYNLSELIISYRADAAFTCEKWPDAGALADLFAKMKAEITALDEDSLYNDIEFPLAQVLADMTRIGILVDKEGIEKFGVKMRSELEDVLTRIHMETGSASFNPNSPKQLGEMLFDTMGLPHGKKTQRGWSTDAETLESLREYPLVEDVLQYRAYQKLNSTYVEGLLKVIGEDGRIHSTFNQTEARTGRLSSDNPNLQNIPIRTELGSQLRAYFIAKPGCVLVDADYSQIELRILAHITGDEHMQQAFLNGEDIHRSTAAKIYGIPQSEVTPRLRSSAKAINFGIMYGKGAYSLSKDIGVTVKEADAFLKNYLAAFPSVSGYMDKTIADAKANGYVSTLFGRRRTLPELASTNFNVRASGERMARNTPIQGTAADVIKLAMVRVWKRLRDEKMASRLILTVHDELIVEAPEAEAEQAARILREEMEGCVQYAVPLSTDVHAGKNWLEAH